MLTDFLALDDHKVEDLASVLGRATELAESWRNRCLPRLLRGIRVGLIVDDTGWRNTTAFDLGITAMGGVCVHAPISLGGAEDVVDLAHYLDNWFDILVVRTPDLGKIRELAAAATAPVINARTRSNRPCETLGDLAFALSEGRALDGLRVCVIAPDDNILGSWAEAAAVLPIEVVQVFPTSLHSKRFANVKRFSATTDLAAMTGCDIVITDCWPKAAPASELLAYQVTRSLLDNYVPNGLFIPCPPVTRGQEVSVEALEAPQCRVIEAKAFLLHAQNALLEAISATI